MPTDTTPARRITNPDALDAELYRYIGRFMGNTMLGIYKVMQNQGASFAPKQNDNVKVLMMVKVLNACWQVMVTGQYDTPTGENVKRVIIDGIAPLIPNESPRCLIHLLYKVGMHIIENVEIEGGSLDDQTGVALTNQSAQIAYLYFKNRGTHLCTGPVTWENMREQAYRPIWELKQVGGSGSTATTAANK